MDKPKNKFHSIAIIFIVVFMIIGIYLRISYYLENRSLWLDELFLAVNIVNRSFLELLEPLDHNQGSPLGFLFVIKSIATLFGNDDYILRLFPLFSGLASIPLMYCVSKRYHKTSIAHIFTVGLFVFSERLIYYSTELKQYSTDVFVILLLLLISDIYINGEDNLRNAILFGIVGFICLLLSHPSLILLSSIALTLGVSYLRKKSKKQLWRLGLMGIPWFLSFILIYKLQLKFLSSNIFLLDFWSDYFMPFPLWEGCNWFRATMIEFVNNYANLPANIVTAGFLLLGFVSYFQRDLKSFSIILSPFLLTLLLSALKLYPFGNRLLLFAVPLVYLLLAGGIEWLYLRIKENNKYLTIVLTVLLGFYFIYPQIKIAYTNWISPPFIEHIKPIMSYLEENRKNSDKIYVYYGARPALKYYGPFYGIEQDDYMVSIVSRENPDLYIDDINTFKGYDRVWIVFSFICDVCKVDERDFILDHLDKIGVKIDDYLSIGSYLYLYDLSH